MFVLRCIWIDIHMKISLCETDTSFWLVTLAFGAPTYHNFTNLYILSSESAVHDGLQIQIVDGAVDNPVFHP